MIAVIFQALLMREVQSIYYGNELLIGFMLSQWLLGAAIGSLIIKKYINSHKTALKTVFGSVAILIICSLLFLRNIRNIFGMMPGQNIPVSIILVATSMIFIVNGGFIGTSFNLGIKWLEELKFSVKTSKIYLLESVGYLFGGIIITLLFLLQANSVLLFVFVLQLTLIVLALLNNRNIVRIFFFIIAAFFSILYPFSNNIEINLNKNLYEGFEIEKTVNSLGGKIVTARKNNDVFYFNNGLPVIESSEDNIEFVENFIYLPMLFMDRPKTVLLIGYSNPLIIEINKFNVEKIDVVESNKWLLNCIENSKFEDHISLYYKDGRKYFKDNENKYDLVFVNLHYPITFSLNRFYTKEFVQEINRIMSKDGVIVLSLPGSDVYMDEYLLRLNKNILNTLESVYLNIKVIPGEANIILAGNNKFRSIGQIVSRHKKLKVESSYISDRYIKYRLNAEKIKDFNRQIANINDSSINKDFYPDGLVRGISYWNSMFTGNFAKMYWVIGRYSWIFILVLLVFVALFGKSYMNTSFTTGLCVTVLQVIAMLALQIKSGSIYYLIALMTALFMSGAAFGAFLNTRIDIEYKRIVKYCEIVIVIWIAFWLLLFKFNLINTIMCLILSLEAGLVAGFEFPFFVKVEAHENNTDESKVGGKIYAGDLIGGFVASLFGGCLLIPFLGLEKTMLSLCLIKIISALRVSVK